MKYTAFIIAASAAIAVAQVPTFDQTTGTFTCPASNPNGAYCAGDSLKTNIIIRCTNGVGQPGNCNDNLAGLFPFGVNFAPCYQTSPTAGDAACSKNCIVVGGSGNSNGTFTLPGCTPSSASSTSTPTSTSSVSTTSASASVTTTSATGTGSVSSTSSTGPTTTPSSSALTTSSITITSTGTRTTVTGGTTVTETFTTTYCPATSTPTSIPTSLTTFTLSTGTGGPQPSGNGTSSTGGNGGNGGSQTGSPTATPVGPTTTGTGGPSQFTGAAVMNSAGTMLAGVGLVIAYFL